MESHLVHGMPEAEYHAHDGISNSDLEWFNQSPKHYKNYKDNKGDFKPTPIMEFGTVVHHLVLTPHDPEPYVVIPTEINELSKNSKQYRDWKSNYPGRICISSEVFERASHVKDSLQSHSVANDALFSEGASEVSAFSSMAKATLLRCRIDRVPTFGNALVDLKTTHDARDGFARTAYSLGYHRKAAWYLDVYNACVPREQRKSEYVLVAVETEPPYGVMVYQFDNEAIDQGRADNHNLLNRLIECRQSNVWPGYPEEMTVLSLPNWAKSKNKIIKPWEI